MFAQAVLGWSPRPGTAVYAGYDETGDFTHFYTRTIGSIFFEVVQRGGGYDGYGAANAPVRIAAQHVTPR